MLNLVTGVLPIITSLIPGRRPLSTSNLYSRNLRKSVIDFVLRHSVSTAAPRHGCIQNRRTDVGPTQEM